MPSRGLSVRSEACVTSTLIEIHNLQVAVLLKTVQGNDGIALRLLSEAKDEMTARESTPPSARPFDLMTRGLLVAGCKDIQPWGIGTRITDYGRRDVLRR